MEPVRNLLNANEVIAAPRWRADPTAGWIAILSGIIAAVGVVFLIVFYVLYFATPLKDVGALFGRRNDAFIVIQYLLTIPLALSVKLHTQKPQPPQLLGLVEARDGEAVARRLLRHVGIDEVDVPEIARALERGDDDGLLIELDATCGHERK